MRGPQFFFRCPHCGRTWDTEGGVLSKYRRAKFSGGRRIGANTGFVRAASSNHIYGCATATPATRRAVNAKDEKRWAKNPPRASVIRNDPSHPGLHD